MLDLQTFIEPRDVLKVKKLKIIPHTRIYTLNKATLKYEIVKIPVTPSDFPAPTIADVIMYADKVFKNYPYHREQLFKMCINDAEIESIGEYIFKNNNN